MLFTAALKSKANADLKGRYLPSCLLTAVYLAAASTIGVYTEMVAFSLKADSKNHVYLLLCIISALSYLFVLSPFTVSAKGRYLSLARGENASAFATFEAFGSLKSYFKAVALKAYVYLKLLAFCLPPLIASSLILTGISRKLFWAEGIWQTIFTVVAASLIAASFLLGIYALISTFMVDYVFHTNKNLGLIKTVKRANHLISGNKTALILVYASLIWQYILCLTVIAIPFVIPHCAATLANFANKIEENKK